MAYQPWAPNSPLGTDPASQLDTFITDFKQAVSDRMQALGVTNWEDLDLVVFSFVTLGGANPYFRGNSLTASIQFQDKSGLEINLEIFDAGDIEIRRHLEVGGDLTVVGTLNTASLNVTGPFSFENTVTFEDSVTFEDTATFEDDAVVTGAQGYIAQYDAGNLTGAVTLDLDNGNNQKGSITGNLAIALSNGKAGAVYLLKLRFTNSVSLTFTNIVWPDAVEPAWSETSGKTDILSIYYDGASYYGFVGGLGYNV